MHMVIRRENCSLAVKLTVLYPCMTFPLGWGFTFLFHSRKILFSMYDESGTIGSVENSVYSEQNEPANDHVAL